MNLSTHFTYEELTTTQVRRDNTPNTKQLDNLKRTALLMEDVRTLLGTPIRVNSGFRSDAVNKAVGGSTTSAHSYGYAIDFTSAKYGTPYEVACAIRDSGIKYDQLIYEGTWVHISFDPRMRQQTLTAKFGKKTVYSSGINK
jgi:hypothetical protein